MKYTILFLVMMMILGMSSCKKQKPVDTETEKPSANTETSVVNPTEGTHRIACKVGETFTIKLEGNPSTGFNWDFETGFNTDLVKFEGTKIESENKDENVVGAPSLFSWSFKALKAGKTEATMKYKRQWEKDPVNEKTLLVEVTISD